MSHAATSSGLASLTGTRSAASHVLQVAKARDLRLYPDPRCLLVLSHRELPRLQRADQCPTCIRSISEITNRLQPSVTTADAPCSRGLLAQAQSFDPFSRQITDHLQPCDLHPGVKRIGSPFLPRPDGEHDDVGNIAAAQHPAEHHGAREAVDLDRQPFRCPFDLPGQAFAYELIGVCVGPSRTVEAERALPATKRNEGNEESGTTEGRHKTERREPSQP